MPTLSDYRQDPFTLAYEPVHIMGECHTVPATGKPYVKLQELPYEHASYPVTVTVSPAAQTSVATEDAATRQANPTVTHGSSIVVRVGNDSGGFAWNSYLKFDLSLLPAVASSASLWLYKGSQTASGAALVPVGLYRVTSAWTEGTVTWNTNPSLDATVWDTVNIGNVPGGGYGPWHSWNITALYNGWKAGTYTNHGLCLSSTTAMTDCERDLVSKESGTSAWHPYISVTPVGSALTETGLYPPSSTQFVVNYDRGIVAFDASLAGQEVCFDYWGMGTNVTAELLEELTS